MVFLCRDIYQPGAFTPMTPGPYLPQQVKWEALVAEGVDLALVSIPRYLDKRSTNNLVLFAFFQTTAIMVVLSDWVA